MAVVKTSRDEVLIGISYTTNTEVTGADSGGKGTADD